jgi:hypothetical protein
LLNYPPREERIFAELSSKGREDNFCNIISPLKEDKLMKEGKFAISLLL